MKCVEINELNFPDEKERAEELRISKMLSSLPNDEVIQPTNPAPTPALPSQVKQIEHGSAELVKVTRAPTTKVSESLSLRDVVLLN